MPKSPQVYLMDMDAGLQMETTDVPARYASNNIIYDTQLTPIIHHIDFVYFSECQ